MTKDIAAVAMETNKTIHESRGITIQGGKQYTKVVHRVEAFRRTIGYDYGIDTAFTLGQSGALCKATITDKDGFIVGSGHAFAKNISAEKSIEKVESTAIGRALASIGLGGDEYASQEDIDTHKERYEEQAKPKLDGESFVSLQNEIKNSKTLEWFESDIRPKIKDVLNSHDCSKDQISSLQKLRDAKLAELGNRQLDGTANAM